MSFFFAIVAVILILSSFVVLLAPAVGGSVGASFTPIIPLWRVLIPLVSSLVATLYSSSFLLGIERLRDHIRFGCHQSIHLEFIECIHIFLNCNSCMILKNLDCNCIDRRKSCINVILEDHVGDCFFGASELSGNVKQFGNVGIEGLTASGTKSAEFPKVRHSSDGGVGSVCAGLQFFLHLNRIVHSFNVYLDSIGTGSVNICQGL